MTLILFTLHDRGPLDRRKSFTFIFSLFWHSVRGFSPAGANHIYNGPNWPNENDKERYQEYNKLSLNQSCKFHLPTNLNSPQLSKCDPLSRIDAPGIWNLVIHVLATTSSLMFRRRHLLTGVQRHPGHFLFLAQLAARRFLVEL